MVQWQTLCVLVLLLVAPVAFAGCTDDPDPAPPDAGLTGEGTDGSTDDEEASGPGGGPMAIDSASALFAPVWSIGDGWTYAVSGDWAGDSFTATYGVVEDNGDHWGMAADSEEAFILAFDRDGYNIFLDGVSKEDMGIQHHDAFQDLVGFKREVGSTWQAALFDANYEMTKVSAENGEIVVEGTAGDRALSVVYSEADGNLKELAIANGEGQELLRFDLQGTTDSASGLFRWIESDGTRLVADFGFETAAAKPWESDGSGAFLYVTAEAKAGQSPAAGRIADPAGQERVLFVSEMDEETQTELKMDDQAGQWTLSGASTGPHLLLTIRQILVEEF